MDLSDYMFFEDYDRFLKNYHLKMHRGGGPTDVVHMPCKAWSGDVGVLDMKEALDWVLEHEKECPNREEPNV